MTQHYSFRKSHQKIYEQHYIQKEKVNTETGKNNKIVKLP